MYIKVSKKQAEAIILHDMKKYFIENKQGISRQYLYMYGMHFVMEYACAAYICGPLDEEYAKEYSDCYDYVKNYIALAKKYLDEAREVERRITEYKKYNVSSIVLESLKEEIDALLHKYNHYRNYADEIRSELLDARMEDYIDEYIESDHFNLGLRQLLQDIIEEYYDSINGLDSTCLEYPDDILYIKKGEC